MYRYRRGAPPLLRVGLLALLPALILWLLVRTVTNHHEAPLAHATVRPILPLSAPRRHSLRGGTAPLSIDGAPSLAARRVDSILAAYGSPLQGHGKDLVALSRRYTIDDAVALAFFVMESRAGTEGEATLTRSFGNLRPMPNEPQIDGYRAYHTWIESADEWYRMIRTLYVDQLHLHSVEAIVPVYAPASDNNDPTTMIDGIQQLVTCWRGNPAACPDTPAAVRTLVATTDTGD